MWQGRQAGGHDWLAIWREMYAAERAQGEAAYDPAFARGGDSWAGRARRFAAASRRTPQPDGFLQLLLARLRPHDTVVDVGAGTGRYLPLLARAVARVIAVEPSAAMRAELATLVAAEGLENVQVLDESWPLARPLMADVVFSAHTVYAVSEVGPFLQAMEQVARRACYLYLGLRHPAAALDPFWARIHGAERLPLPAALEALCCLHQLGFYATMELVPAPRAFHFADAAEALEEIRMRLHLAPEPARDALIRAAAAALLVPHADGLAPDNQPERAAVIWWQPAPKPAG